MDNRCPTRRRAVVLVTGMSGTGKSSVLAELVRRGHRVVDTDDPGWIVNLETVDGLEPVWDLARIRALVESHRAGWLCVAGCVANQGAAYDRFDAIVLLSAPVDELLRRVASRANPFGSTSKDRAKITHDQAAYEPLLRAGASHEIVITTSVAGVATTLETIAEAASGA
jgi:predicted ATPase